MRHITMITGDAPKNVAFYADVLGALIGLGARLAAAR
jgi:catechol 2,3-dioxygenase-like lactoylglutathione lyase family enzyme